VLETVSTLGFGLIDLFPFELSSPSGDSFLYLSYAGALNEAGPANGSFDLYRAQRVAAGWETSQRLSQPSTTLAKPVPGGVSADQGYAFSKESHFSNPKGQISYLRSPDGSFELIGIGSLTTEPFAYGRFISRNGGHVIFSTGFAQVQSQWCFVSPDCSVEKLEPDAPPSGTGAVYDRPADGPTHVVSLLPGNETPLAGEQAFYKGTSTAANTIAFQIGTEGSGGKVIGTLYARVHNGEAGSEETLKVAEGAPVYAGMSNDGRYIFYLSGGESGTIHRWETETGSDLEVNPSAPGEVVNISADGSHVYFISEDEIGGEGEAGKPNLFDWNEGTIEYVATVLPSDLVQTSGDSQHPETPALTNWTDWVANQPTGGEQGPGADSSRTTPDGRFLVFESKAQLTPYENAGHTEIYRWDEDVAELSCASCNPLAPEATKDVRLQEVELVNPPFIVHNLSRDGSRVFFETEEALVNADINGANDVYEWHQEGAGGTIALISSGKAPAYPLLPGWISPLTRQNLILSITPDGSDVFFTAKDALTPAAGENGTQAIYDARINGGFPIPTSPEACSEESCKLPAMIQVPSVGSPQSETTSGAGNVKEKRHRCKKRVKQSKVSKKQGCQHRKMKGARSSSAPLPVANLGSGPNSEAMTPLPPGESAPGTSATNTAGASVSPSVVEPGPAFAIQGFEAHLCATATKKTPCDPSTARAGTHPDFTTNFEFTHTEVGGFEEASAAVEDATFTLPPGLIGNPAAVPACSIGDFASFGNCSAGAQVGITQVKAGEPVNRATLEPIYNLTPPHPKEEVARFGFFAFYYPVYIDVKVRTAGDYGVTATVRNAPGLGSLIRAKTTFWANPASSAHDSQRLTNKEVVNDCSSPQTCEVPPPGRPSTIPPENRKAFLTNPSACQEGAVGMEVTTYQLPGQIFTASAPLEPITDCQGLPFAPTFTAEPTSHVAGAPTGLHTSLVIPQHLGPDERATATMREARVTLPEGMQAAAGAANWIGTCSEAQVGYHQELDTACPDHAKLGTATITSPALAAPIQGTLYQRSPRPGHQLGLWLTADALGLHIKLPGDLEPDKQSGRLTAVFGDLPQVPVSQIDLDVWGGPRAPLQNPDRCGSFTTDFTFTPHSDDPPLTGHSTMQITEGCNQPFSPTIKAGVTNPIAGAFSPFVFDLTRPDANQALRGFDLHLPDGELAKIAGVPLCSEAEAAAASCPAASRIGSLTATAGPGPDPFTIPEPGRPQPQIYFAGPYQGAPFSIVSEVPAQAGPFDLGTLAVRSALQIDPESGRATVKADPLPQFFEGVAIAYRHLHAVIDRPEFSLNPTDCSEMAVTAEATSTQGALAHPSARFQLDGCKALKFAPKLSLALKGGTRRADYPALTATLKARKGDANIAFTSVALPHSEFLAQEHFNTICTRKQFAADTCPKGSIYGKAKATSPLLDKPLSGPVYLRSSDHPLPDVVVKLDGQIEIDLVGRVDSVHGGIRATFESLPDAPVTKFVLQMKGGKKGLFINSTDICRGAHRATVKMKAQNGRVADLRPRLQSSGCGSKKLGKHKKH
jgi:hypothetical protein